MNSAQHILVFAVRLYRWTLSPAKTFIFGPLGQCRFTPSCSGYALHAIRTHGALIGGWLALKRLGRCHPWGGCGDDPVPEKEKFQVSGFRFQISKASGSHNSVRPCAAMLSRRHS